MEENEGKDNESVQQHQHKQLVEVVEIELAAGRPEIEENEGEDKETVQQQQQHKQLVKVVFLPGYPQSAYPKARNTRFFREEDEYRQCHGNLKFCTILMLAGNLLRESILLQFKKENWDRSYDVALTVWMVLVMAGSFPVIFIVGTILSNRRILRSKQGNSQSSYALVQNSRCLHLLHLCNWYTKSIVNASTGLILPVMNQY